MLSLSDKLFFLAILKFEFNYKLSWAMIKKRNLIQTFNGLKKNEVHIILREVQGWVPLLDASSLKMALFTSSFFLHTFNIFAWCIENDN